MKRNGLWLLFLFFFIGLLLVSSCFTIKQGQGGILLRLGRIVKDAHTGKLLILSPGLHCKMPLLDTVRVFDTRLQTVDIKSSRIVTKEKKDVMVDYYVKWRIDDLAQYYKSTGGNQLKAETLLEQQLNTSLRAQFGRRLISDVVSGGRDDVMAILRDKAENQAMGLGIHVVDVRIKGIELPANTSNAIYQRMRADMQKIANRHRADGQASAEAIQANADAQVTVILAEARSQGEMMRADGQAKAAEVYASAYAQDKGFFHLFRRLKTYERSFTQARDIFVLDANSPFFKYFKQGTVKEND